MRRGTSTLDGVRAVASVAVLILSLGFVVWRQSRALEELAALDGVRSRRVLLAAERAELLRRIQTLESRGWIIPQAERRLGLRTPQAEEIVILPGVSS